MTTAQNITIQQGATFSQALTLDDTSGKSYRAKLVDRFWCAVKGLTCTVTNSTTVTISLTATETAALCLPGNMADDERSGKFGYWDIEEVDGVTVTRTHQGVVTISREATA